MAGKKYLVYEKILKSMLRLAYIDGHMAGVIGTPIMPPAELADWQKTIMDEVKDDNKE